MRPHRHLPRSRQLLLDELKKNPEKRYRRAGPEITELARENDYKAITFDTSLVDLASKGHIRKARVGRIVEYWFPNQLGVEDRSQQGNDSTPSIHSKRRSYTVTYAADEDGYIVASVPALPGCHSQGHTRNEARRNIQEAMRGYLASLMHRGEPLPEEELEEVVVVV